MFTRRIEMFARKFRRQFIITGTPELGGGGCASLPQLKEISFKKAITVGRGVNIIVAYILHNLFKFLWLTFFKFPPPMRAALCK